MATDRARRSQRPATARGIAVLAVLAAERGARANVELPRLLQASSLDQRDRAFATELSYGTLRMCRACDWLVGQFARGDLEPEVRAAARIGAYQLAFMNVPAYAAVSATVAECPPRARALLNAVLRRVAGLVESGSLMWPDEGTRLSYPDWVMARLAEDLGRAPALAALVQMNVAATVHTRPDGYVQDPASQQVATHMAALLAGAPPGPVLDLCAGPGGKATALVGSSKFVVAFDVRADRASQVRANAKRLQLANLGVVVSDGRAPAARAESFSGVLVDAPCSGLGALRRRPDARWRVRPHDIDRLALLQRDLLVGAASLVAPGGLLVYSVCTLTLAETRDIDEWLDPALAEATGVPWQAEARPGPPWEPLGRGALLLPQAMGTDGMYMLSLRRGRAAA
ncbi:MAG TPA: transcription antitermination factor NusB [Acidimicrobiales bacterium]|nr:transcription antitermination factor NusB [Acidimicrobiales bacterium]